MPNFQFEKNLVLNYIKELDNAGPESIAEIINKYASPNFHLRCVHPFNDLIGAEKIASNFWTTIKKSFMPLQRRMDIFYAGSNLIDNHETRWVTNMGHLLGLFQEPFLGIPATQKAAFLRYAEFYRIENEKIVEGAFFLDIMNFMQQLGLSIIPESTGVVGITPGPMTHDGLKFEKQPEQEGIDTLNLITRMAKRLVGTGMQTTKSDLELDWTEDMLWWGPGGIGASYTQKGYLKGHTRPFEDNLDFVSFPGHILENAEGNIGGWFGWPSLLMKAKGNYMGLTSTSDKIAEMRVVDLYRRSGDKLSENWIFIDHLHFLKGLGIDLLDKYKKLNSSELLK